MQKKLKLAVLVSGNGTNLQAMIDRIKTKRLSAEIVMVISDNPDSYGIKRARQHGIPYNIIDYTHYDKKHLPEIPWDRLPIDLDSLLSSQRIYSGMSRQILRKRLARKVLAEREVISAIDPFCPDYICLAGYMRLLSPFFINHYQGKNNWKIINIHPAFLPAFPGLSGYDDTLSYGCRFGGVTVHFVDEGKDSGPIIGQAVFPIWPRDNLEIIRARGLRLEYELYSQCLNWLANDCVKPMPQRGPRLTFLISDPGYRSFMEQLNHLAWEN